MTSQELMQWCVAARFYGQMTGESDRANCIEKTKPAECTPTDYHIVSLIAFFAWRDIDEWATEAGINVSDFGIDKLEKFGLFENK